MLALSLWLVYTVAQPSQAPATGIHAGVHNGISNSTRTFSTSQGADPFATASSAPRCVRVANRPEPERFAVCNCGAVRCAVDPGSPPSLCQGIQPGGQPHLSGVTYLPGTCKSGRQQARSADRGSVVLQSGHVAGSLSRGRQPPAGLEPVDLDSAPQGLDTGGPSVPGALQWLQAAPDAALADAPADGAGLLSGQLLAAGYAVPPSAVAKSLIGDLLATSYFGRAGGALPAAQASPDASQSSAPAAAAAPATATAWSPAGAIPNPDSSSAAAAVAPVYGSVRTSAQRTMALPSQQQPPPSYSGGGGGPPPGELHSPPSPVPRFIFPPPPPPPPPPTPSPAQHPSPLPPQPPPSPSPSPSPSPLPPQPSPQLRPPPLEYYSTNSSGAGKLVPLQPPPQGHPRPPPRKLRPPPSPPYPPGMSKPAAPDLAPPPGMEFFLPPPMEEDLTTIPPPVSHSPKPPPQPLPPPGAPPLLAPPPGAPRAEAPPPPPLTPPLASPPLIADEQKGATIPSMPPPPSPPQLPLRPPLPPLAPSGLLAPPPAGSGLPAMWDARTRRQTHGLDIVSPVRFQGTCNACVAFAVLAAAETALALATNRTAQNLDFSEQHLFFCDPAAIDPASVPNCRDGWAVPAALAVLQQRGVRSECCYPYDVTRGASTCARPAKSAACAADASGAGACNGSATVPGRWRVAQYSWGSAELANVTAVKELVRAAGSAIACFRLYDDMTRHRGSNPYRWNGKAGWSMYHCAQLVGWNDHGGFWIFKSSWGVEVGERGFFKILYGEAEVLVWGVHGIFWQPADSK